jgi:NADP-dependent 3-hydroxy acid dehydrogenase YdfG
VLAVARDECSLRQLAANVAGTEILAADATSDATPWRVFEKLRPDVLVVCGGARPPEGSLHQLTWKQFAVNWEVDTRIAFNFCKAALTLPVAPGTSVIVVSSGAALGGSPNSGGYAGAKRTQIFVVNYSQKESDRLDLGIKFAALAPQIIPDTELGKYSIASYSRYLGMTEGDLVRSMDAAPSAVDVAEAILRVAAEPFRCKGSVFVVSGNGLEFVS